MYIDLTRLKRILREERLAWFLKKHGILRDDIAKCFEETCHSYGYEWTEEELFSYTGDDNISFQIEHTK